MLSGDPTTKVNFFFAPELTLSHENWNIMNKTMIGLLCFATSAGSLQDGVWLISSRAVSDSMTSTVVYLQRKTSK